MIGRGLCLTFASRATITQSSSPEFLRFLKIVEMPGVKEIKSPGSNNAAGWSRDHLNGAWDPVGSKTFPVAPAIRVADDEVEPPGPGKEMHIRV